MGIAGETSRDRDLDVAVRGPNDRIVRVGAELPRSRAAEEIVRPRLSALLDVALQQRLTLVVAPRGYGKTVTLMHWRATRPAEVRWLGLTRADDDPQHLAARLVEALGQRSADIRADRAPLREDWFGESVLAALRRAVDEDGRIALVLDDLHRLTDPGLLRALSDVIDRAPNDLHFVVTSGMEPPVNFYRLRWSDVLVGLNLEDLAFTRIEARELLEKWGVDLSDDDLAHLVAATEGWVTGLRLAADHIADVAGHDISPESLITAPTGIAPYLLERVLLEQPPELQRFLVATSVLYRMNGPLCDHLMSAQGSQSMLEDLTRRTLLITRIETRRGWFRYHALLRTTLRQTLRTQDRGHERELLLRAADWHLARDEYDIGVTYLLEAEAWDAVIDVVVKHGGALLSTDGAANIASWLARVPRHLVRDRRDVRWLEVATMVFGGLPGDADAMLAEVEPTEESRRDTTPAERVVASLLRAYSALQRGSADVALSEAQQVLYDIDGIDDVEEESMPNLLGLTGSRNDLLAAARLASGVARFYEGDLVAARFELAPVVTDSHAAWRVATLSALSLLDAWSGALCSAERLANQALSMATELGTDRQPVARARIALASVACDRGRLDEALALLEGTTPASDPTRGLMTDTIVRLGYAEVAAARGDADAALDLLTTARAGAPPIAPPLIVARWRALESHLSMATGDHERARRLVDGAGHSSYELDAAGVRLAVEDGDLGRARSLLSRMADKPEPRAPLTRLLWTSVLDWLEGRETASHAGLSTVVASAEPEGDIALFRTAGTFALTPTRALFRAAPTPFLRTVIESLAALASPRPRTTRQLVEQLTEREYKVLTLLPTRLSSAEIGDRLGISLNTVKTHLKHLYRKLDVSGRNEAVATAERLHLL
jgi:LuxR family maltose regulon positive regulatory protein